MFGGYALVVRATVVLYAATAAAVVALHALVTIATAGDRAR